MLKKVLLIVGAGLGGVVLLAAGALLMLDARYEFLRSAPRVEAAALKPADATAAVALDIQGLLDTPAVQDAVSKQTGLAPKWLKKAAPYSAYLFLTPDLASEQLSVTLAVNDQRFGPLVQQRADLTALRTSFPSVRWAADGVLRPQHGVLWLSGKLMFDANVVQAVRGRWTGAADAPVTLQGGHLLEAQVDNTGGGGAALALSIAMARAAGSSTSTDAQALQETALETLAPVAAASLTADLQAPDTLAVRLVLKCGPNTPPEALSELESMLNLGKFGVSMGLSGRYGAQLEGAAKVDGTNISGDYTIKNAHRLIEGLAGAIAR